MLLEMSETKFENGHTKGHTKGQRNYFFCGMGRDGTEIFGTAGQIKNGTSRDKMGSRDFCYILLEITIHQNLKLENRHQN